MTSSAKPDNLDEEKAKYNRLIREGKECLERALDLFQRAYEIFESEKLLRKIEKVKVKITIAIVCSYTFSWCGPCMSHKVKLVNSPN